MSRNRRGEKVGWVAGWTGAFLWVTLLSLVFLFRDKMIQGILGLILSAIAVIAILGFLPWRHQETPYWKLMLVPYGVLLLSIVWAVWSFGGLDALDLNVWNLLWLIPALIPFGVLSNKRWADSRE